MKDIDRYHRTVGEVILPDGRSLNLELVKAGLAWWYVPYAKHDSRLADAEAAARKARRTPPRHEDDVENRSALRCYEALHTMQSAKFLPTQRIRVGLECTKSGC